MSEKITCLISSTVFIDGFEKSEVLLEAYNGLWEMLHYPLVEAYIEEQDLAALESYFREVLQEEDAQGILASISEAVQVLNASSSCLGQGNQGLDAFITESGDLSGIPGIPRYSVQSFVEEYSFLKPNFTKAIFRSFSNYLIILCYVLIFNYGVQILIGENKRAFISRIGRYPYNIPEGIWAEFVNQRAEAFSFGQLESDQSLKFGGKFDFSLGLQDFIISSPTISQFDIEIIDPSNVSYSDYPYFSQLLDQSRSNGQAYLPYIPFGEVLKHDTVDTKNPFQFEGIDPRIAIIPAKITQQKYDSSPEPVKTPEPALIISLGIFSAVAVWATKGKK